MRFCFADKKLARLYTEEKGRRKYPKEVIDAFFDVMAIVDAALDERDLRAMKSLHYERLEGKRRHQHSLALHGGFRLIVERGEDEQGRLLWVISIEDYH